MKQRKDNIRNYKPYGFGNAILKTYLSTSTIPIIPDHGIIDVIIDEKNPNKLSQLLKKIVDIKPTVIEIHSDGYEYLDVLGDEHTELLNTIPIVGIPMHTRVTDKTLQFLQNCIQIEISGCKNIYGTNLPTLIKNDNLLLIKKYGWGPNGLQEYIEKYLDDLIKCGLLLQ